jgi:hypothetical protein
MMQVSNEPLLMQVSIAMRSTQRGPLLNMGYLYALTAAASTAALVFISGKYMSPSLLCERTSHVLFLPSIFLSEVLPLQSVATAQSLLPPNYQVLLPPS